MVIIISMQSQRSLLGNLGSPRRHVITKDEAYIVLQFVGSKCIMLTTPKVLGVNDRLQSQKLQCWHACCWRHFNDCEDLVRSLGVYNMWPSVIGTAMNGLQVYEHITYDDHKHMSIASFPDMQQRSIVTSSLSKTFSVTGVRTLCQFSQFLLFILLGKLCGQIFRWLQIDESSFLM